MSLNIYSNYLHSSTFYFHLGQKSAGAPDQVPHTGEQEAANRGVYRAVAPDRPFGAGPQDPLRPRPGPAGPRERPPRRP